ncbi:hypothetical protein ACTXJU_15985 [Glutamicibacter ardleyensis]|uniref:hypothetical protein n=1 Tax=Glutamicibacter ardleyensis TaxID=225894 RepID=UPI003FD4E635
MTISPLLSRRLARTAQASPTGRTSNVGKAGDADDAPWIPTVTAQNVAQLEIIIIATTWAPASGVSSILNSRMTLASDPR